MIWVQVNPNATMDHLGLIPSFLDPEDVRTAAMQFDENYCGGWRPSSGFTMDKEKRTLKYPGDPDLVPLFMSLMGDELIFVYDCGYVAIVQPDETFEVSRLD